MVPVTRTSLGLLLVTLVIPACGSDGDPAGPTKQEVVESYAELVHLNYEDALNRAVALQTAVDRFVADPTPAGFEAAKRAWLEARVPYGQSEVFRFYEGPIDASDGPEGQLNAWPMDEVYVDYVEGDLTAGIINDLSIELTRETLIGLNEGAMGDVTGIGGAFDEEKAISTGYHAIEFLLWGQDLSADGPGTRSYADYLVGVDATADNGDRRGEYLRLVTALLVDDLQVLVDAWAPGASNYRADFLALDVDEALTRMLTGAGVLSKGELAAERMDVALETLDQEDEHSCFSDNTHTDILMNATGIQNVWLGRYEWYSGPGVIDLVLAEDPALADEMDAAVVASIEAIVAVPAPFDRAIGDMGSPEWNAVNAAVNALFDQADKLVEVGLALGLENVSVDLPE